MREITSGTQKIRIRASNLVYTIFYQEFHADLSDELKHIEMYAQQKAAIDSVSKIDEKTISALIRAKDIDANDPQEGLRILSEMGIADNPMILSGLIAMSQGNVSASSPIPSIMKVVWAMNAAEDRNVPAYDQWERLYDDFDFVNTFSDIYLEIQRGFFRSGNTQ